VSSSEAPAAMQQQIFTSAGEEPAAVQEQSCVLQLEQRQQDWLQQQHQEF